MFPLMLKVRLCWFKWSNSGNTQYFTWDFTWNGPEVTSFGGLPPYLWKGSEYLKVSTWTWIPSAWNREASLSFTVTGLLFCPVSCLCFIPGVLGAAFIINMVYSCCVVWNPPPATLLLNPSSIKNLEPILYTRLCHLVWWCKCIYSI